MRKLLLLLTLCIGAAQLKAQTKNTFDISFEANKKTISKTRNEDKVYQVSFKAKNVKHDDWKGYKLKITVNQQTTSLPASDFTLDYKEIELNALPDNNNLYIVLKKDSIPDRPRKIYLTMSVSNAKGDASDGKLNTGDNKEIEVTVNGIADSLNGYNYLAYIGTNFDLVEGIKAQNVYFGSSIFVPKENKLGIFAYLYGNRAMTITDTIGTTSYTSKYVGFGDSAIYYTEEALKTQTRVVDNLGAMFSPLIPLGSFSKETNTIQIYYSPQFEFIWRRATITTEYANRIVIDSIVRYRPITGTHVVTPAKSVTPQNIYDVYLGLAGFTLRHENDKISVRIQTSVGLNFNYVSQKESNGVSNFKRTTQGFFFIRGWITEPTSGITLGAEINNTFGTPNPYYNVTLSKAINFKNLGTIFQPLTSR